MAEAPVRLPAGRHGLPREFVVENQRERIMAALVDTVAEKGYNATTVADITKAASVSRRTFYEHFTDKEACFLVTYDRVVEHLRDSMRAAAESCEEWAGQLQAGLSTMVGFFAEEPDLARLLTIEPVAAGGEVAIRHRAAMQGLCEILKAGRPARSGERPLPEMTEEALVGGMLSLIVRDVSRGEAAKLEALIPDLVELTLAPYLGSETAERLVRSPS